MRFDPAPLEGAWVIAMEPRADERGMFARCFCEREFAGRGLITRFPQSNVSFNSRRGTLRGMHFQRDPRPETKLVRCTRGSAYDVIVDLRRESPTWRRWWAVELTEENRLAVYIPGGFAHGFQTLSDATELLYMMGEFYVPELADGVRWDDPAFGITWPVGGPILSERDRSYADYTR